VEDQAEAIRADRHRRGADGAREEPGGAQAVRGALRAVGAPEEDGEDRAIAVGRAGERRRTDPSAGVARERGEVGAGVVGGAHPVEVGQRQAGEHRGGGGGVDEAPGAVPEVGAHRGRGGDERAVEPEGLAEGADEDVRGDAGGGGEAAALGTEDAEGVRLVEDPDGVRPLRHRGEGGEVGAVAVHAEVGLGDHEAAARGARERGGHRAHVPVGGDGDGGAGEAAAVHEGRVIQGVRDDEVAGAGEGGEHAEVGGVAAGEEQRRRGGEPGREGGLEPVVVRNGAEDEARRPGPGGHRTSVQCFT
jgi:hypothetical protein